MNEILKKRLRVEESLAIMGTVFYRAHWSIEKRVEEWRLAHVHRTNYALKVGQQDLRGLLFAGGQGCGAR